MRCLLIAFFMIWNAAHAENEYTGKLIQLNEAWSCQSLEASMKMFNLFIEGGPNKALPFLLLMNKTLTGDNMYECMPVSGTVVLQEQIAYRMINGVKLVLVKYTAGSDVWYTLVFDKIQKST